MGQLQNAGEPCLKANGVKVALITGASSGIGYETAKLLATRGWSLAITARRKPRLDTLANELCAKGDIRPQGGERPPLVLSLIHI